jgi:hypothetical protein
MFGEDDILGDDFLNLDGNELEKRKEFYCKYKRLRTFNESDLKKIKPIWATGPLLNFNMMNRPDKHNKRKHVYVKIIDLIEKVDFGELNPTILFTGKAHSISRYITTLDRWENGLSVDPPDLQIFFNSGRKQLKIADGRHRTILSFHVGALCIPVCVNRFDIEYLSDMVELCDENEIY